MAAPVAQFRADGGCGVDLVVGRRIPRLFFCSTLVRVSVNLVQAERTGEGSNG
jgi:hypothetical protein